MHPVLTVVTRIEQIELHEMIGQGTTADIHRATWRGLHVAVKWMRPEFFLASPSGEAFFAQELDALSRQRHPHVLRLMGACLRPPESCFLVTELLSGATLGEWLHGGRERRVSSEQRRASPPPPMVDRVSRALEVALAMRYLHEQTPRVVHRDLKPSNVLLDGDSRVRVADFGHARFLPDGAEALTGETGKRSIVQCTQFLNGRACSALFGQAELTACFAVCTLQYYFFIFFFFSFSFFFFWSAILFV